MAISIVNGNRGTATEKVDDTSLTFNPSGTLSVGNYGLLAAVVDNQSTSEGETNELSVTDTSGNTWVKLREQTEANTAADTGVTIALFLALIETQLTTGSTIAVSLDNGGSVAKGAGLAELSVAAGQILALSTSGDVGTNGAAQTSYSAALSGLSNVAGLYIGMAGAEEEVDASVTLDASYTALGFGSIGSGTAGAVVSNVRARVGTLANTSTGDTFDATGLNSADRATILVRLEEVPDSIVAPAAAATAASTAPTIIVTPVSPAANATSGTSAPNPEVRATSPASTSTASAPTPNVDALTPAAANATGSAPTPTIVISVTAVSAATGSTSAPTPLLTVPSPVSTSTASTVAPNIDALTAPAASASASSGAPTVLITVTAVAVATASSAATPVITVTSPGTNSTASTVAPVPEVRLVTPVGIANAAAPTPVLPGSGPSPPFASVTIRNV